MANVPLDQTAVFAAREENLRNFTQLVSQLTQPEWDGYEDTKKQILNYLLENDRYKTISSTQVMKDLNLKEGEDISLDVIRTLRQTGFPNFSVEGYDNTSLVATENINPRNLDKARVVFQSALKKNYKNLFELSKHRFVKNKLRSKENS